ncbi:class I SAM-dependent methyltransferase [Halomonas denitrificans]|nr:class I SAM-dependent methyltransferase [Halomonas denitrificans]
MHWQKYKTLAQTSRDVIVFPFFYSVLKGKAGVWLDVGCGSGDLTCDLSKSLDVQIVGVDKELPSRVIDTCSTQSVHLVKSDLTRNGVSETGIIFDGAYSNCCFCHLDDDEFLEALVDIWASLKVGAEFVFLVPSFEWAREMYDDVIYEASGITAVPRYGGRQHFRIPAWYKSALNTTGFTSATSEAVLIPDNAGLDVRYRSRAGRALFTAFRAIRAERIDSVIAVEKAFDIAHDNRKLEIQLFWQRSLFFWGFVAAALVGYLASINEASPIALVFALFGLVCSVVWSQGNRGSKYWQEYWEDKVNVLQHFATGNIFYDKRPKRSAFWNVFAGRRVSVSKLTMALSDFTVFVWFCLCLATFVESELIGAHQKLVSSSLLIGTLLYCLFLLRKSKSED